MVPLCICISWRTGSFFVEEYDKLLLSQPVIFLLSYHGASVYLHILKDWEFFVEEYDRLLLSQPVIFLLSYHGAPVYLHILEDREFFC